MSDSSDMVSYLMGRIRDLEAQVSDLSAKLRANADKQKNYRRRSVKTAARSNVVVSNGSQRGLEEVTTLPQSGNDVTLFPSQTLPISRDHKKNKYSSPLADFLTATWPEKPLTEQQEAAWRASCPGIDLLAAARSARAWQLEDMARRQRPRALQFLGNWFRNEQQRLRAAPARPGAASLHITPEAKRDHAIPGRKIL
jgi:hypothetical protein